MNWWFITVLSELSCENLEFIYWLAPVGILWNKCNPCLHYDYLLGFVLMQQVLLSNTAESLCQDGWLTARGFDITDLTETSEVRLGERLKAKEWCHCLHVLQEKCIKALPKTKTHPTRLRRAAVFERMRTEHKHWLVRCVSVLVESLFLSKHTSIICLDSQTMTKLDTCESKRHPCSLSMKTRARVEKMSVCETNVCPGMTQVWRRRRRRRLFSRM